MAKVSEGDMIAQLEYVPNMQSARGDSIRQDRVNYDQEAVHVRKSLLTFSLVKMYAIRVLLLLCLLVITVKSKCTTTYVTYCETVSDVQRFALKSWENLMISPDMCSRGKVGTLDEILEPKFFGKAKNIEELYVMDKIHGVEAYSFDGLTQLTYIKLYKNQLKVIRRDAFANLFKPIKIDLQHNSIENIGHGLFTNSTVININLSHNKLTNLQIDALNLPTLEKLSVKHNDISYIAAGSFHENLQYLDLAHNSLSQFDKGVLETLINLRELVLSHNRLKGIAIHYGLPSLEKLDLSHNEIVHIEDKSFSMFPDLKHLKLNHNYITYLSHNVFAIENNIRSLHLHYNAIMQLQEPVGRILQQLEEITISGNPWACPCLNMITSYLTERNVTQPDCDTNYFAVGKSAVCVITEEVCTGGEKLTKEAFENFRNSLNIDLCSDL
ncbi:hypothetical protein FQR65_LT06409 [Abscondita terminalis]|nr:hypothetical protein FQR65_LT06409 [Abscondita terminalis]